MFTVNGRSVAALALRAFSALAAFLFAAQLLIFVPLAHAIVVRGVVTDALGKPVAGARVQLIQGQSAVAAALSGIDGTYEIRSTVGGRFALLTSSTKFYPGIGQGFYGGPTDVVTQDVVLEVASVHQEVTVTATGIPTPLEQASSAVTLIPDASLATTFGIVDALRQSPGVDVVQLGQAGGVTSLFVRGGPSDGNKVLVDGIPAEDVGGIFDFGTVSSTGVSNIELYRGPNSALFGSNSQASVVSIETPRGSTLKPVLNYSGDAGNLHTYRNEAAVSGVYSRLDYLAGFSRFDTSNALPDDEFHSATSVANLGVALPENTLLRFTLRDGVSAEGLTDQRDFYGVSQNGKEADQDLYSGLTLENRTQGDWHNLLRYGIARKTEQAKAFAQPGTLGTVNDPYYGAFPAYFGKVVTIRGANGYSVTGAAQMYESTPYHQDNNRDELYYQSDYVLPKHVAVLFGFRYDNERGSFNTTGFYGVQEYTQRTNFEYNVEVQGDVKSHLFYSLGGSVEKNHQFGLAGTPRFGLAYVPIRPSARFFHGTKLRANVATGVQEPSLADQFYSLDAQLIALGDAADIAQYHIAPLGPEHSRTADVGVDQNIVGEKLVLKAGYFHNQFSHQIETVGSTDLATYLGLNLGHLNPSAPFYDAEVGTLAYRAQGVESELEWQPHDRWMVRGGYTYLDAVVERSFAGDETGLLQGFPTGNPTIPGVAIGAISPLVGARPFRRPPHTGFFALQYAGRKLTAGLKGAMASRSDDSTFLLGSDATDGNTLLLPNRNLDFGYAKLDANFTYAVWRRFTVFSELDNLLSQQHIGPIGYPSLPFTVRAGLKVRIGGE